MVQAQSPDLEIVGLNQTMGEILLQFTQSTIWQEYLFQPSTCGLRVERMTPDPEIVGSNPTSFHNPKIDASIGFSPGSSHQT
jgi:hypothetical protein